jgi:hypothetical protein
MGFDTLTDAIGPAAAAALAELGRHAIEADESVCGLVLFGSRARGTATEKSDWDIAVLGAAHPSRIRGVVGDIAPALSAAGIDPTQIVAQPLSSGALLQDRRRLRDDILITIADEGFLLAGEAPGLRARQDPDILAMEVAAQAERDDAFAAKDYASAETQLKLGGSAEVAAEMAARAGERWARACVYRTIGFVPSATLKSLPGIIAERGDPEHAVLWSEMAEGLAAIRAALGARRRAPADVEAALEAASLIRGVSCDLLEASRRATGAAPRF